MDIHKQKQRIRSKIKLDQSREKIKHRFRKVSDFKKKKTREEGGKGESNKKKWMSRRFFREKSECLLAAF
jgi:hypothetical protein